MDLKSMSKEELVEHFIRCHDAVRSQTTTYANALGSSSEVLEKAEFDRRMKSVLDTKDELLRRMA